MFELVEWLRCVVVISMCGVMLYYIILLYIYIYYYIIYYTYIIISIIILYLILYSSPSSHSSYPPLLLFYIPLPSSLIPSILPLPSSHSFKVYVSAFGYPYLYSISIQSLLLLFLSTLPIFQIRQFDPACFIGVDG